MHAWLCENPVGVDALTWKELPTPEPGVGQVLIRIEAASLIHTSLANAPLGVEQTRSPGLMQSASHTS